jgi:hypothetical protein
MPLATASNASVLRATARLAEHAPFVLARLLRCYVPQHSPTSGGRLRRLGERVGDQNKAHTPKPPPPPCCSLSPSLHFPVPHRLKLEENGERSPVAPSAACSRRAAVLDAAGPSPGPLSGEGKEGVGVTAARAPSHAMNSRKATHVACGIVELPGAKTKPGGAEVFGLRQALGQSPVAPRYAPKESRRRGSYCVWRWRSKAMGACGAAQFGERMALMSA